MLEATQKNIKIPTINALTGLRGAAALWVVIFHIWDGMGRQSITTYRLNLTPLFIGEFGVDIFFILSGFAVFLPCAYALKHNLKISWKSFYLRRMARLFPAYHASLLAILLIFSNSLLTSNISIIDILKHIFLLQNLPPQGSTQIHVVYWTLPIEMNFYLLIPILFFIINRYGIIFSLLLGIFSCVMYRYFVFTIYGNSPFLWLQINQLFGRLDEFMIGISASVLFINFNETSSLYNNIKNHDYLGIIVGIIGIIIHLYFYYFKLSDGEQYYHEGHLSLFLFNTTLAISIGILIISLALQGKMGTILFANPIMLFLGTISYGIYLWHLLIHTLLIGYFQPIKQIDFLQEGMIGVCITIAVASLSYFLLEKPIMNFVKINLSKNLFKTS